MTPEAPSGIRWVRVSLPAPPAGEGFRLVDALHRLGAREIWREGKWVRAHLPRPSGLTALDDLLPDLRAAIRAATSLPDSALVGDSLTIRSVPAGAIGDSGGAAPAFSHISPRLGVVPAGAPPPDDGRLRLHLGPSGAFGSPRHATTRACLRALDAGGRPGDRLIDVGTGSGILAIAAVLLGAARVDAFEADPAACEAARHNVRLNRVADRVRIRHCRVTPAILGRQRSPDGVMANLEPDILLDLLPALATLPRAGGHVLISGVPRSDLVRVRAALSGLALTSEREEIDDGWWTGWFHRPGTSRVRSDRSGGERVSGGTTRVRRSHASTNPPPIPGAHDPDPPAPRHPSPHRRLRPNPRQPSILYRGPGDAAGEAQCEPG